MPRLNCGHVVESGTCQDCAKRLQGITTRFHRHGLRTRVSQAYNGLAYEVLNHWTRHDNESGEIIKGSSWVDYTNWTHDRSLVWLGY